MLFVFTLAMCAGFVSLPRLPGVESSASRKRAREFVRVPGEVSSYGQRKSCWMERERKHFSSSEWILFGLQGIPSERIGCTWMKKSFEPYEYSLWTKETLNEFSFSYMYVQKDLSWFKRMLSLRGPLVVFGYRYKVLRCYGAYDVDVMMIDWVNKTHYWLINQSCIALIN